MNRMGKLFCDPVGLWLLHLPIGMAMVKVSGFGADFAAL
jgi:hypothetical protein